MKANLESALEAKPLIEHRFRPDIERSNPSHIHVRVFSGPKGRGICNGTLIFTPEEWESFVATYLKEKDLAEPRGDLW